MKRSFGLLMCVCVAALLGLTACGEAADGPVGDDQVETVEQAASPNYTDADGCRYLCQPCPSNQICTQVCEPIGKCAHKPEREECGDTLCAAGQVCCNASCGICTEPGGVCTQQVCEDTSTQ